MLTNKLKLFLKKERFKEDKKRVIIAGTPISPYKAIGKVRVIKKEEALEKIRENEIIVLIDSTPLMVPYLIKSKGFIGERGGMLCHLAVISREFEKACVNGITGITKILENGDEVKVDGINGIIEVNKK